MEMGLLLRNIPVQPQKDKSVPLVHEEEVGFKIYGIIDQIMIRMVDIVWQK
jgi:hypothetical protein